MDFDKANEERYYQKEIEELEGGYCMPLLYETPNGDWALLSEAALTPQYSGGQIVGHDTGMLDVVFSPEQFSDVVTTAPFTSPWRFMVIGDPADIAENTLAETLSPDSVIEDTSWIVPSPVDWTWLNGDLRHDNLPEGTTWEETAPKLYKQYIDFAAEMGWKYQLLDEGWQPRVYNRGNDLYDGYYDWMQEVLDYAESKGIGLIVWANKRDLDTPEERERIKEWAEMGIKGIKPDFFDSQSQEIIQLLDILTKEAAENHMLINIHGAGKTTGERRTYPNAICREAISGGESCVNDAYFDCMLPFTRFAVGAADFTPMASYGNTFGMKSVTQAHLVAQTIMFECGIQTMADKPDVYRGHVAYENLFKNLPTSWDDSILLDGDPGHYVNMARRTGDDWYVSIMGNEARIAEFDLDFLEDGATYTAYIFRDSDDPTNDDSNKAIITETKTLTKGQTMSIDIKATGGAVVKIIKNAEQTDWTELKAALDEAKSLDSSKYTAASWNVLETAVKAAEQLPADADQAAIDASVKAIKDAIDKLVRKSSGGSSSSSSSSSSANNTMGSDGVVVAVGTGAATAQPKVVSDTTVDFTVKSGSAYCFKMTVVNGNNLMPSFTVGNGNVLKTQFVTQIGNDYYFRVWAVGTPGQSTGVYTTLPGYSAVKHCTITIG